MMLLHLYAFDTCSSEALREAIQEAVLKGLNGIGGEWKTNSVGSEDEGQFA